MYFALEVKIGLGVKPFWTELKFGRQKVHDAFVPDSNRMWTKTSPDAGQGRPE